MALTSSNHQVQTCWVFQFQTTHCQVDGERPTLSLSSLFGRKFKKRRKKQHITVDDLEDPDSEDDDYKVCPTQIITTTQSPSFVRAQE